MYRKFIITDTENKKIRFKVYPDQDMMIVTEVQNIDISWETDKLLNQLILLVSQFMTGNTINKLEVQEIEE